MKQFLKKTMALICALSLVAGCGQADNAGTTGTESTETTAHGSKVFEGATVIELSDEEITVDGSVISDDTESAVYAANDIVFYLEGQDFTYGEGEEADAHSQEEADAHTVVHITQPGTYAVSGKLSAGQIAIDLGEDAEEDPEAVVTLILNGVDITCSVAPAVIFYNVYECGSSDAETATNTVDTAAAGANVLIADDSVNNVAGSYVARIYKPDSVVLSEDGTEVEDAKKLHKYDAAFYSKKTMNVNGDENGSGVLNITAENEGLDSELHLTINGGNINIVSGNDGINTNEDEVSVTTVNGGTLKIRVSGTTGEGDGVDSNGWLVINGGTVIAEACSTSGDAGIDSDMGIHINGGTVIATGNMLDRISESTQNYAVFSFAGSQKGGETYTLKNEAGEAVFTCTPENDFSYLIVSSAELTAGTYSLWQGENQMSASAGSMMGGFRGGFGGGFDGEMSGGGEFPEGMEMQEDGENPDGFSMPEGMYRPEDGEMPDMQLPEGVEKPDGMERPVEGNEPAGNAPEGAGNGEGGETDGQMPEGGQFPQGGGRGDKGNGGMPGNMGGNGEASTEIIIVDGGNYFSNVAVISE